MHLCVIRPFLDINPGDANVTPMCVSLLGSAHIPIVKLAVESYFLTILASHDLNTCLWLGEKLWSYLIGCFPLDTNIIWSHNTIPRQAVSCWLAPCAVTCNTCHANPVMKRDRPSVTGMEWILQMKLLVIYSLRDHLLGVTSLLTQHPCNHMFHQTISIAACTHKTRYTILTRHSIMC